MVPRRPGEAASGARAGGPRVELTRASRALPASTTRCAWSAGPSCLSARTVTLVIEVSSRAVVRITPKALGNSKHSLTDVINSYYYGGTVSGHTQPGR